jgi:hypothetical protein
MSWGKPMTPAEKEMRDIRHKARAYDIFIKTALDYLRIRASLTGEAAESAVFESYCYSSVLLPRLPGAPELPDCCTTDGTVTLIEALLDAAHNDGYELGLRKKDGKPKPLGLHGMISDQIREYDKQLAAKEQSTVADE